MEEFKKKLKKDIEKTAKDTAKDLVSKEHPNLTAGQGVDLTEKQMFDLLELFSYGMLQNLRRSQCIDIGLQYLEDFGITEGHGGKQISNTRLITIYNTAKRQLYTRTLKDIQGEKDSYVKNLHRLAMKAENAMDFKAAISCLKEIATVAGVYKHKEESQIVLNFLPASKDDK